MRFQHRIALSTISHLVSQSSFLSTIHSCSHRSLPFLQNGAVGPGVRLRDPQLAVILLIDTLSGHKSRRRLIVLVYYRLNGGDWAEYVHVSNLYKLKCLP